MKHVLAGLMTPLDIELPDLHQPNKAQLEKAMAGHILDQAVLIGTYQKE